MSVFEIAVLGLLGYIAVNLTYLSVDLSRKVAAIESLADKTFYRVFNIQERENFGEFR